MLHELLGTSPALAAVRDELTRLIARPTAPSRRLPPVLIQGETGTGKGLVARLIHQMGPRSDAALVDVNCAAIPETLLEAELFGFERGAFTDAKQAKVGLLQVAHRGTIFLDEIGLMADALQAKQARILFTVPQELYPRVTYPMALTIAGAKNSDSSAFYRYLQSEDARTVLGKYGFALK